MKLYKALKKGKRRPEPPPAPPIETAEVTTLKCFCMVCGEPTGLTKDIRSTLIDPKDLQDSGVDLADPKIRDGLCRRCTNALAEGCTIIINQSGTKGAIFTLEATHEKLEEAVWGKLVAIPDEEYDRTVPAKKEGA